LAPNRGVGGPHLEEQLLADIISADSVSDLPPMAHAANKDPIVAAMSDLNVTSSHDHRAETQDYDNA
jgi:hypothetical protein